MAQINISCDDRFVREIDRIAAARGERRPALLRKILDEAIEAHDAGRPLFQATDQPRIDGSLNAVAIQLREAVLELDRVQRANLRHEKRMIDLWNGGEEANRIAQQRLSVRLNEIAVSGYAPFVEKVKVIEASVATARADVETSVAAKLGEIDSRLEAIRLLASKPGTVHNLVFGDDRKLSTRFLLWLVVGTSLLSIILFLAVAGQFSSLAVPVAEHLLSRSSSFCRLIDRTYKVENCVEPGEDRRPNDRPKRSKP